MDMNMGGMDGMASTMNMSAMSFTSGPGTMLYSMEWMPMNTGSYAGTCIFLVVLGIIYRGLTAGKAAWEHQRASAELQRRVIVVRGKADAGSERVSTPGTLVTKEGSEDVRILSRTGGHTPPWRLSSDLTRATFVLVLAGIGYLL